MTDERETPPVPDEDHSTGSVWRADKHGQAAAGLPPHITPCTPQEQARHWAELCEAISGYVVGRPGKHTAREGNAA